MEKESRERPDCGGPREVETQRGRIGPLAVFQKTGTLRGRSKLPFPTSAQCYLIGLAGARFTQNCYQLQPVLTVDSGARWKQPLGIGVAKLVTRLPFSFFSTSFTICAPTSKPRLTLEIHSVNTLIQKFPLQSNPPFTRRPSTADLEPPSSSRRQNDSRIPTGLRSQRMTKGSMPISFDQL